MTAKLPKSIVSKDGFPEGEGGGWRAGKPDEDPEKLKHWGLISAKPSEYLVHFRGGKLRERSSGQGASCFKWPSDTVAVIPTTLKEVLFEASQITSDNVDVKIRGMGIYRIADPRRTFRLFNFSFRERAEQKLAFAIADMCRSTAKWLVSNMSVEECIRKRKEEIAAELRREIAQVVGGENGWGVEVATIHIQDVWVVNREIFEAMQEEHKSRVLLSAERARLERELKLKEERLAGERAAKEAEVRVRAELAEVERAALARDIEGRRALELQQISAAQEKARRELERDEALAHARQQTEAAAAAVERARVEAAEALADLKARAAAQRAQEASQLQLQHTLTALQGEQASHREQLDFQREARAIENAVGEGRVAERFITEALPQIAQAFSAQFARISVHQWGGENASGLSPMASAFGQLLEVAKSHGVDLPRILGTPPSE